MQALNGNLIEFGEFRLDVTKKILWRESEVVPLPLKAVELLCVLVENRGEVINKIVLMEQVWKDSFVEDSVLTQNIYLLRKTLQSGGAENLIKNVPRRGYLFNGEVREAVAFANGAEFVIERHLFEKISLEETDVKDAEIKRATLPTTAASPRRRISASIFAVAILLGLTVGAYFYFRADSRQTATIPAPPIKLKTVSAAPSSVKMLAILPLKSSDESFASGFSNDLSVRLGSQNKFTIKPFALVKEYEKNGAEVAADFILDGDVRAKNNMFGANIRLLDTKTGVEIWTNKFEFDNLIQLQDAIANQVSKEISNQLTDAERETISKRLPTNLAAYENFQNGYQLWRSRKDGTAYFQKAIELDQSFAKAYAILANVKATGGVKDSPLAKEAEKLLQKAFELDENLADAYAVQGFIQIFHQHDWENAEKSLQNALALDANNVNAHHWLAVYYSIHRRLDEAKAEMHKALETDPTNPTLLGDLGQLHYFAGEKDLAIKYCENALIFDPDHIFANSYLAQINQPQEIKDKEAALKQLEQIAQENSFALPYINIDSRYDSLRDEPRFQQILRKINLAE